MLTGFVFKRASRSLIRQVTGSAAKGTEGYQPRADRFIATALKRGGTPSTHGQKKSSPVGRRRIVGGFQKGVRFSTIFRSVFDPFFASFFDVFLRSVLASILDPIFDQFWDRFGGQTC
jgi:hypothetical protein